MMKSFMLLLGILALIAAPVLAAEGIVGKKGETAPVIENPSQPQGSGMRADVEWSTTGAMDTPASLGGSASGWGYYFITSWLNTTGQDVTLVEFGWPCGGPGPVDWVVWITAGMPGAPGTQTFGGLWTPVDPDGVSYPPDTYTYIDVSASAITIPAGQKFYFGYENPGIGGQISYNGVETWAWYENAWDSDVSWGRTAVLQFKGNFGGVPAEQTTFTHVKQLFD